ncbi:hypothetical protein V7S43_001816 [Phytophthora oleae]|uniref:Uncharacterized protein n=1 Tax=Phytophthora oleae TaxID=2107226 RepID=A0ABD3G1J5_9STRA
MHASCCEGRVPVDTRTTLRATYAKLCRQACVALTPCCHKEDYTHLPVFDPVRKPSTPISPLLSQAETFKKLCKEFCRHKLETRVVLDYAFGTFGEEKAMMLMNELTIPRIQDPERRATLLLSLMHFRSNTNTHCCGFNFCFNCKCLAIMMPARRNLIKTTTSYAAVHVGFFC